MNSTFFGSAFLWLWELFSKSYIYKVLKAAYKSISNAWFNSFLVSSFLKNSKEDFYNKSIVFKIFYTPFWLLSLFALPWGASACNYIKKTKTYNSLYCAAQNLYAANTRFIGLIVFFASLIYIVAGRNINMLSLAALKFGFVLILFDFNITPALNHSIIKPLLNSFLGIDTNFEFYNKEKLDNSLKIIVAIIMGIVTGFLAVYFSLLYAAIPIGILAFSFNLPFAIGATIFIIPFIPTMAAAGLCILCTAILVINKSANADRKWKYGPVEFLIVLFMTIFAICSFTSFSFASSIQICILCIVLMSFYFIIVNSVKTKKQLTSMLLAFVISALLVSLYGIVQYIFKIDMDKQVWLDEEMFSQIKMRAYSTLENPNVLGEYLLLTIPVCIAFFWSAKKALQKISFAGILTVLMVCMVLTMSRGCWLGLLVAATIFITFVDGRYWLFAIAALLLAPILLPQSILDRFLSIGNLEDTSSSYRLFIWLGTLRMLKDFWLVGVGPGINAFNAVYPHYSLDQVPAPHSHNVYLQITTETGIVGLFAFMLICFMFFKKLSVRAKEIANKNFDKIMIISIASGVAAFLFQGIFDYVFYNYRVFLIFWVILALGMCFNYINKEAVND